VAAMGRIVSGSGLLCKRLGPDCGLRIADCALIAACGFRS